MKFSLVCLGLAACIAVVHCQFGGDSFLNLMMMQRMLGGSARGASGGANPLSALMGTGATGAGASTSGGSNPSTAAALAALASSPSSRGSSGGGLASLLGGRRGGIGNMLMMRQMGVDLDSYCLLGMGRMNPMACMMMAGAI